MKYKLVYRCRRCERTFIEEWCTHGLAFFNEVQARLVSRHDCQLSQANTAAGPPVTGIGDLIGLEEG